MGLKTDSLVQILDSSLNRTEPVNLGRVRSFELARGSFPRNHTSSVTLTKMEDYEEYDRNMNDDDDMDQAIPDDEEEITQEDAWAVISAYFEEKGLVRQQLDSFDEFIQNTMQEIVDESADIEIRPESQHNPGHQSDVAEVRFPENFLLSV